MPVLAAVALLLPAAGLAQEKPAQPPADMPLTIAAPPLVQSGVPEVRVGVWRLQPEVLFKQPPPGSSLEGVPRWNLGFRAERPLFSRLNVGAMASFTRGQEGPLASSTELGSDRDLWYAGSLTGPGSYRTVFNSALTWSVPLKDTGHVRLKLIGEFWNPLGATRNAETGGDVLLNGRALKIGLRLTF